MVGLLPLLGSMPGGTDGSQDRPCSQEAHRLVTESGDYTPKMSRELHGGGMPREYGNLIGIDPMKQDCSNDSINPRAPGAGG